MLVDGELEFTMSDGVDIYIYSIYIYSIYIYNIYILLYI